MARLRDEYDEVDRRRGELVGRFERAAARALASRTSASLLNTVPDESACTVHIEPSLPWLIALSIGMISSPRTSPTITRSGFMRRLMRTSSAAVTSADAFDVRVTGFERDDVGVQLGEAIESEFELGFDRDDSLVGGDLGGERAQHRGLAGAGRAGDDDLLAGSHRGRQRNSRRPASIAPSRTRSSRVTFMNR